MAVEYRVEVGPRPVSIRGGWGDIDLEVERAQDAQDVAHLGTLLPPLQAHEPLATT
jgi:hypothetical protein